ncbi:MAG: hypothetical protein JSR18_11720 [Proteobacteria bacterium]|nr:hypothetical protein [Pseudomonadota bacterium]
MAVAVVAMGSAVAPLSAAPTTLKGAAILDTPCGKTAVKQMGMLHNGDVAGANKLTTAETQKRWASMPAKDRDMMADMAKSMSPSSEAYAAAIRTSGVMVMDGNNAHLKVTQTTKDANGSSTSTTEQSFAMEGGQCLVSR